MISLLKPLVSLFIRDISRPEPRKPAVDTERLFLVKDVSQRFLSLSSFGSKVVNLNIFHEFLTRTPPRPKIYK